MNAMRHAASTRATRRPLPLAILLALAACAAAPAIAQGAAEAAAAAEPVAQDAADAAAAAETAAQDSAGPAAELEAVIVTANKREQDVRTVAASISVVDAEQLENLAARQLSDFADYLPGVQVVTSGTPGQTIFSMRGIAALSSGATVGTYIDEVPVGSSGVYQAATLFSLDLLPYDIARVEVLRGPQGTLYGAGAMGGLFKYVTREPDLTEREFRFGGGVSDVEGGSALGNNIRFGANVPLSEDQLGLRVSYAHNSIPGYIDNVVDGERNINTGSQTSGRAELLWQGESISISVTAMGQEIDSENNALMALDTETQDPYFGDLENEVFVNEPFYKDIDFYSGTLDWDLGWANFVSATGYTDTQTRRRVDTTVAYGNFTDLALGLPEGGSSYFDNGLDLQKFTQEFRLTSQGDGPFEWLAGAFYTRETGNNTQFIALNQLDGTPLPAPFDGIAGVLADLELPSRYEETAVFANGAYRFTDWFKLEAGVRYAENDQEFSQNVTDGLLLPIAESPGESSDDVFTWSVAPQFQVAEDVMVYARAATGYQPGGPNVVVTGLPPVVDSSTLTSYELGLKSTFIDNRLLFDVTAFRIDWEDIQVVSQVNGVGGLVNGGEATSNGVELSTAFRATDNLQFGLNATYTDVELDEDFPTIFIDASPAVVELNTGLAGDALPYIPQFAWSATTDYYFPVGGMSGHVGAGVRWVDDRVAGTSQRQVVYLPTDPPTILADTITPPLELDSYYAVDLYADLSSGNWTVRAYARNVTDERAYSTIATENNQLTGEIPYLAATPIQPRTFGIEFDFRF